MFLYNYIWPIWLLIFEFLGWIHYIIFVGFQQINKFLVILKANLKLAITYLPKFTFSYVAPFLQLWFSYSNLVSLLNFCGIFTKALHRYTSCILECFPLKLRGLPAAFVWFQSFLTTSLLSDEDLRSQMYTVLQV